jgi:hypothetical protein
VIDSESVKATESGGPRGHDAGKKIKSRKRHAMVDTDGRGWTLSSHSADIQDRDGAAPPSCSSYAESHLPHESRDGLWARDVPLKSHFSLFLIR